MMRLTAILLAAGRGLRFGSKIPKPLAKACAKPIIIYSLEVLSKHPLVKDIIVVVNNKNAKGVISKIRQYHINKVKRIVQGGLRRQDSVLNALSVIDGKTDLILIHDAARPFIYSDTITSAIEEAKCHGAAIVGVPVKATIKKVVTRSPCQEVTRKTIVKETLDRSGLWEIQTPQVFRKDLILKAYKKLGKRTVATDDAMLVEKLGARVSVVLGSYDNIKITTPEDLVLAEAIAKRYPCLPAGRR